MFQGCHHILGERQEETKRLQLYSDCCHALEGGGFSDGWMKKIGLYDQDDDQVIRRVIAGEINAFERLVARHGPL